GGLAQLASQADTLTAKISGSAAFNTNLPVVNQTLNSVLDAGAKINTALKATSAVSNYLSRLDSATDQLTLKGPDGYYVLTDGTDYAALAFNASANDIRNALGSFRSINNATFGGIQNVNVAQVSGKLGGFDITALNGK